MATIKRMNPKADKRIFKKTANRQHIKNNVVPRGGIRL